MASANWHRSSFVVLVLKWPFCDTKFWWIIGIVLPKEDRSLRHSCSLKTALGELSRLHYVPGKQVKTSQHPKIMTKTRSCSINFSLIHKHFPLSWILFPAFWVFYAGLKTKGIFSGLYYGCILIHQLVDENVSLRKSIFLSLKTSMYLNLPEY